MYFRAIPLRYLTKILSIKNVKAVILQKKDNDSISDRHIDIK